MIELLLVTTAPVMVLAAHGIPNLWTVLATLVGGTLSAGSANAFNCYIDRDIDRVMKRTQKRPLVTGDLRDVEALAFAWISGAVSIAWLWFFTTPLAAILSFAAIAFYVLIYTLILKRRTPQNIVWGGAAGCMPVLIGWAAVTGSLDWAPSSCSGSCSCGRRRTTGRCRCATRRITPRCTCRCWPSFAPAPRLGCRSCCTRGRRWRARSC
ncbi:hypothetical protein GCM10025881_00010 [Pseudolysinimonas kribbensis]|uniref:Protoheme IX farnesyltransferase n=1 Tax=Pseudolysinimonas kribbensis TaxID=433641 RepID=A0ABQ6JXZ0_9MICO|nr:hypothetical protein GCM10025881_00010 [Pseudolysinimonas kribbensis]